MQIDGSVALVTGAASGIGRATALKLAGEGARVAVVDVDETGGKESVAAIESAGGSAVFVRGDVSSPDGIAALFADVQGALGVPSIVHNNAGIMTMDTPGWPEVGLERIHAVVNVNVGGVILGTREAVAVMKGRGGVVINTGSIAALAPMPNDAVYSATKAAVLQFTKCCAALAETEKVRVNAVIPGMVDTPIIAKTGDGVEPADWLRPFLDSTPLLPPEQIAETVLDLVRDDALAGVCRMVTPDGTRDI